MPCLIVGEVIFFFSLKVFRNTLLVGLVSSFWFVIGLFCVRSGVLSFAMINIAMVIQLFMFMGYLFRIIEPYLRGINWISIIVGIVFYLILCFVGDVFSLSNSLDVHLGSFGNVVPFTLVLIVFGNALVFALAMKIKQYPRLLIYIGQNTLLQYMWAGLGIAPIFLLLKILHIPKPHESMLFATICFVSSVLVCCLCSIIINRYCPFMVGKTKVNKQ